MRVLMVSDHETHGGAGTAASRLARGLLDRGHEVIRAVCYPDAEDPPWETVDLNALPGEAAVRPGLRRLPTFVQHPARRLLNRLTRRRLTGLLDRLRPDVVNLHNLHAAVWPPELAGWCAARAPTVWRLPDQWSFTGRCTYSYDCRRFETGCNDRCPTPREYPSLAPSRIRPAWERRRRMLDRSPGLTAVTPSRWLAGEAKRGLWREHRVEVIHNALPLDHFAPRPRPEARARLGLEVAADRAAVLLFTTAFTERRKGADLTPAVLERMAPDRAHLLTVGEGRPEVLPGALPVTNLGYLRGERLVQAYAAADLYVHPAPVDNYPSTVMEAIACGTPVLAFAVGGVPEMVRPPRSGWLVDRPDPGEMAEELNRVLRSRAHVGLEEACRGQAEAEWGLERQAAQYERLFRDLAGP